MKPAASSAALLVLLAAAMATGTEEGGAPLAGTKKELQQLQTDRKGTGAPEVKDGLKASAPALHLPAQSAPRPSPEQLQRLDQQRSEARNNWLIDGMTKPARRAGTKALLPGETDRENSDQEYARIDTSDPAYLLKLYDKQKKTADPKSARNKDQRTSRPDAFAAFLKDWMADSPVKDQLLGDLARQNGAATALGETLTDAPVGDRGSAALPDFSLDPVVTAANANPYLTNTAPAVLDQPGGSSPLLATPGGTRAGPPVPPSLPSATESAVADRKAPPPPLADEKKYFPQLNKF